MNYEDIQVSQLVKFNNRLAKVIYKYLRGASIFTTADNKYEYDLIRIEFNTGQLYTLDANRLEPITSDEELILLTLAN